jgi:outer membrane protein assembly factor BamE
MFDTLRLRLRFSPALISLACLGLVACGSISSPKGISTMLSPYKIDKVQGNVVTREQLAAVKVGMPKAAVKDILGTPLLSSVFHGDRWDYVFTLQRQGIEPQMRRVAVFFNGDILAKVEADELPSEAEFVASLKSVAKIDNLPPLTASDENLKKFPLPKPAPVEAPLPPVSANYPPLDPNRK